ncbi:MAG: flagellar M-ring protein FliF C-terminal domain-containing protein, partial [Oscillospiraceae bacterium]
LPDTDGYVLSSSVKEGASAGVTVTMTSSGKELTATQVSGIKRLVANSVPTLKENDVVIVDTGTGNELSANGGGATSLDMSQFKFIVESQFETDISKNIRKVLDPLFGGDNVKIAVKSVIDVDKKIQEVVTYKPSEDNKGVVSSEQTSNEQTGGGTVGGTPGTDSNTDETLTYPGVTADGNKLYIKDEASYEYLVSSVKEQIQKDSGQLQDLTISVVLNTEAVPETKRAELSKLIANAAAVDPEKVVIYTDIFTKGEKSKEDKPTISTNIFDEKPWLMYVLIAAAVIVVLIVVLALALKKKKKKKGGYEWQGEKGNPEAENTNTMEMDSAQFLEIHEIQQAKGQAMKREIQDFTDKNPEITAQLVRSLLKGDDHRG